MTTLTKFMDNEFGTISVPTIQRQVYKYTRCGAWIEIDYTGGTVDVGSIVEGSDVEVRADTLRWPFTAEAFWDTLRWVEDEAEMYWLEANPEEEE